MKKQPNWNMSHESARRFSHLLERAAAFGIDADAVTAAGLPAWRTLTALQHAADSKEGAARDRSLDRAQDALRALDPRRHSGLVQQFQVRLLALRGRNGDDEVGHLAEGEVVVPKSLQTREVMQALEFAAGNARIPMERLRVGAAGNSVNPNTGASEFADPMEEIKVTASRSGFEPQPGDVDMLARLMFAEGADHYARHPEIFAAIGWSAFNRIGNRDIQDKPATLQEAVYAPKAFTSVTDIASNGGPSLWKLSADPDKLTGPNKVSYNAARQAATQMLSGQLKDPTGGAQLFHSAPYTPSGFQDMLDRKSIAPIGNPIGKFKFFRTR